MVENNTPNDINKEISKYCEIKQFSLQTEKENTNFIETDFYYNKHYHFIVMLLGIYFYIIMEDVGLI